MAILQAVCRPAAGDIACPVTAAGRGLYMVPCIAQGIVWDSPSSRQAINKKMEQPLQIISKRVVMNGKLRPTHTDNGCRTVQGGKA